MSSSERPTFALVVGGGTGGHVIPAIAIAQALVAAGHPAHAIHFVGSARGMERRLVPAAGFEVTLLPGRGIARRLSLANVAAVAGLLVAFAQAVALVRRRRPAVVVSVGGYASAPCALAAAVCRVPLVVQEQNAVPGLANRLAARFARAAAVSFPGTRLPRAVLTGNPVRAEMQSIDRGLPARRQARLALGLPTEGMVVAAAGGSLGSGRLNAAVLGLARAWAGRAGLAIYHVVGEREAASMAAQAPRPEAGGLAYQQVAFCDRMDLLYEAADVSVQRAGASTVSELAAAGMPSLLVPLPGAPADHQTYNARQLEAAGGAILIPDAELTEEHLAASLAPLLADPDRLQRMGQAARRLARPQAAADVAALAEAYARASPDAETPATARLDLSRLRRVHVIGLGGSGMSAIATVLVGMGLTVSGSDLRESEPLRRLEAIGVTTHVGHEAANLAGPGQPPPDLVSISTAVPATNPEVVEARRLGIPVASRAEVLAAVCATRRTLAVAGTHGKTTTSSMLALILRQAGWDPAFVIGGDVHGVGGGGAWGSGDWMVVEADESDGTFLALPREGVVVTSVEPDHLEHYGDEAHMVAAYREFMAGATGPKVAGADEPGAAALVEPGVSSYGTAPDATLHVSNVEQARQSVAFDVTWRGQPLGRAELAVPGLHNARNASGALALALSVGVPWEAGRAGLAAYRGVARRWDVRGERHGVTYIDDYAHLPGEVRAVLATARATGWDRVVAVFQPHRYSRTQGLAADFADAFTDADVVVVTDIYPAGEAPRPGVTGQLVADAVAASHPDLDLAYLPTRAGLVAHLSAVLRPGDLCLTLGAGDLTTLPDEMLAAPEMPGR